tara:strand:+ start:380 stop:634 length:255 start_codon:yes stop_codon:yes gene_type:complete
MNNVDTTYNGWTNWETWNIALWVSNDEYLYNTIWENKYKSYTEFYNDLKHVLLYGNNQTQDGISWTHPDLNLTELNNMIQELGE